MVTKLQRSNGTTARWLQKLAVSDYKVGYQRGKSLDQLVGCQAFP